MSHFAIPLASERATLHIRKDTSHPPVTLKCNKGKTDKWEAEDAFSGGIARDSY